MTSSRLVRHVMWVDVLAQHGMLVAWGVMLLAQAALIVVGPAAVHPTPLGSLSLDRGISLDFGILVIRFCWTVLVAALLIQSDCLVGTTAFWMTRPVPRQVLFAAKLLSAILWFVVVPIVVMAGALLWAGMGPLDALAGGGWIGLEQAVILAMAIMAALVTANVGQLVVAGIAGVTVVAAFNGLLLPVLTLAWPSVGGILPGWQPVVYITTVIAGALVVTAYHYFRLRAWHSLVLVAATMLLATTLTRLWPAPPAVPDIGPVPENVVPASSVSLHAAVREPRIEDVARLVLNQREVVKRIEFEIASTGEPPNLYFWPAVVTTEIRYAALPAIRWSGPTALVQSERAPTEGGDAGPWRSLRLALGDVSLAAPLPWTHLTPVADVTETELRSHSVASGQLKSDVTMLAYKYEVVAAAPLAAGAGFRCDRRAGRIVSVTGLNPGARVEVRETLLDGPPPLAQGDFGATRYLLRNSARRQAVPLTWAANDGFEATVGITATSVKAARGVLETADSAARLGIDAAWLAGAELVLVEPRLLGMLTRPLVIDGVMLSAGAVR